MSGNATGAPAGSQTVGPYFRIGLEYLIDRRTAHCAGSGETVEIRGRVLDRDGVPVTDAMLEFWSASSLGTSDGEEIEGGIPEGFRRVMTDTNGAYAVVIGRPGGWMHSNAHFLVLVFARGLLRHLLTRVYLGEAEINENDEVLQQVPQERRATLAARADEKQVGLYWWDVVLQGVNETVFFAW